MRPLFFDLDLNYPSDDFQSLLLVHAARQFNLIGCGAVAGNTWMEEVYFNIRETLEVLNLQFVPVFPGDRCESIVSNRSWALECLEIGTNPFVGAYSKSLQPRISIDDLEKVRSLRQSASKAILQFCSSHAGTLEILATGPLTNLALAVSEQPDIVKKVSRAVFMGGHFGPSGLAGRSDFNVWFDAEAASTVFASKLPILIVPLEICRSARSSIVLFERVSAAGKAGLGSMFVRDFAGMAAQHGAHMALCDQLAALLLIDRSLVTATRRGRVVVDRSRSETHGRTTFVDDPGGAHELVTAVDVERAHDLLVRLVEELSTLTPPRIESPSVFPPVTL